MLFVRGDMSVTGNCAPCVSGLRKVSLTVLLVRCAVVVDRNGLIYERDSWRRVAARGVGLDSDVPVAAEGLQVLAVESLAGRGGDEVVVLLILGESAAGAGDGGGENSGSLHFRSMWFILDMFGVV